jgi:hypothetical protein
LRWRSSIAIWTPKYLRQWYNIDLASIANILALLRYLAGGAPNIFGLVFPDRRLKSLLRDCSFDPKNAAKAENIADGWVLSLNEGER